jgi:protein phosphatase 2C family protein 2/3
VICVPEITETDRCEEDEFVILGCDGVWERYVANSQKLIDLMGQLLQKHENSKVMMDKLFGQLVARDTKDNFGFDNMTAQLIQFQ